MRQAPFPIAEQVVHRQITQPLVQVQHLPNLLHIVFRWRVVEDVGKPDQIAEVVGRVIGLFLVAPAIVLLIGSLIAQIRPIIEASIGIAAGIVREVMGGKIAVDRHVGAIHAVIGQGLILAIDAYLHADGVRSRQRGLAEDRRGQGLKVAKSILDIQGRDGMPRIVADEIDAVVVAVTPAAVGAAGPAAVADPHAVADVHAGPINTDKGAVLLRPGKAVVTP